MDAADPEAALQAAGLYFAYDSAVCWVTPAQLAVLTEVGRCFASLFASLAMVCDHHIEPWHAHPPGHQMSSDSLLYVHDDLPCVFVSWCHVCQELEAMEATMSLEITGYYITDCLLRARHANDRVSCVRTARGVRTE